MRVTRAISTDGRIFRAANDGYVVSGKSEVGSRKPEVTADLRAPISAPLARILRPQAAYRWMLPQLAAITPQYIEMVLRSALAGNHVQQWELFDLMLDSWPELSACAQELADGVSCLKMIFEPFAEEDEDPTPAAIERCKLASSALRRMAPDAAADENDLEGTLKDIIDGWFRGVTCLETDWQVVSSASRGQMVAPRATFWVHPVCFGWNSDGRLGLRVDAQGQVSPANLGNAVQGQPGIVGAFPPHKFLLGIHKTKSGTALGGSLLRPLAWWWCAANFSADWLLNLAQIFGLPFRWANYDPTAPQETVDRICSMLQNMGSAGWAAFPAGTTMELKEASGKTGDSSPQGELLDRADRYARLLILGQTQSGGKGSAVGGQAFGAVESDVKKKRIEAAGRYACRVFNTQLIPSILTLNYGDADECPQMRLLEDEEGGLEEAQRDQILDKLMPLSKSFLRKKYGQPEPTDAEDETGGSAAEEQDAEGMSLEDEESDPLASGEGEGHAFRGNQYTGGRGIGTHKPPRRMSDAEADRLLVKGFTATDKDGDSVHFGVRLKNKLESDPSYAGRKELLRWARETVRSGNKKLAHENNEDRQYYGKFFNDAGEHKGMMVIVSVHDGEAFNIFRAPRKYLRKKGLSAKDGEERDEPGEQPPVAVLRALAAAGGAPDWFHDMEEADEVKAALGRIAAIEDDALFAKALEQLTQTV